jgi:hypothetical protein
VVRKKVMRPKPAVKLAQQNPMGMQTVVLVVQTRWAGEDVRGSITQLCIWHVMVVNAARMPLIPAKSI